MALKDALEVDSKVPSSCIKRFFMQLEIVSVRIICEKYFAKFSQIYYPSFYWEKNQNRKIHKTGNLSFKSIKVIIFFEKKK